MHTSAHAASAVHYSFFMLRGPGRYTSDRHAGIRKVAKRCAKKRERVAFMREQHNLLNSNVLSDHIERQIEDDEYLARTRAQDNLDSMKFAARQRYLDRMGEGALFWDNPSPDSWQLVRAWYDNYDQYDEFWSECNEATIVIDRQNFAWLISVGSPYRDDYEEVALPFMEHSLEQVQQYARLLHKFNSQEHHR